MNNETGNTPTAPTEPSPETKTQELPGADRPPTQDSKNLALLCWVGSTVLFFIPGLAFYLVKKEDAYVQDQAKEALNWTITSMLLIGGGQILMFVLIGFLLVPAAWICHLIFCIMGAVAVSDGKHFRVPFALRLIK